MNVKLLKSAVSAFLDYLTLPVAAKLEHTRDFLGLSNKHEPDIETAIEEAMGWLSRAQDNSLSHDGGVARHFSLISGWGPSYPETTGYIIPTCLEYAKSQGNEEFRHRAKQMLDWLVSIQFPEGGFQGGSIYADPVVPVTFNTGQILLGLAAGVREFGTEYHEPMSRAADWLVKTQDSDGCWRKFATPFAVTGEKTYETHVAWGLLEAFKVGSQQKYLDAALANVYWALGYQQENGWFDRCCLTDPSQPLTHTLGYVFRGLIEAYQLTKESELLNACEKTANGLSSAMKDDGFLPGRLKSDWTAAVPWVCLTGNVQIAYCWLKMYQFSGDVEYRDAAYAANQYVRRTIKVTGSPEVRGGIKGSFPIYGKYGTYQYLNWACKFFVDSNVLEKTVRDQEKELSK